MHYSFVSAAVLALTSTVFAQKAGFDAIISPFSGQTVVVGSTFEIKWQPGNYTKGTSTIVLLQGATAGTLQIGETIVADVANSAGSYTWDIPADVPVFKTYGFKISLNDDPATPGVDESQDGTIFQYSFPFHIATSSASAVSSGTVTVLLGTGTAYTPTPTPTPSASTTSSIVTSTWSQNSTSTWVPKPTSNLTLTSAVGPSATSTGANFTSGLPPAQTANAAMANAISGSIALVGGVVLAFAL